MKQEVLYDYFYDLAYKMNQPVSVMIELLTQCNLKCEHCYLPAHNNQGIPLEKVKKLLLELRDLGVVNVSLTGGEIFLRSDLFEIIRFARNLHMRVFLLSNGTLLNDDTIKILKSLDVSEFSTTLFSMEASVHDSITCQNGSLNKLLLNLKKLKENGINVRIKTPIMKKNANSIEKIRDFCKKNEFEFLASPLIFCKNDGDTSPKRLRVDDVELTSIMKTIDENNRNSHLHVSNVPCTALFYSFAIDCSGNVHPCNSFLCKVGNVYDNTLKEIWYNSKELQKIKSITNEELDVCNECQYKNFCDRCPALAYMENNDLYACDRFSKKIAKLRYNNYLL